MFGAIYIGLSGLSAHAAGLKQVSNNVTNLNTAGFKGTTVSFRDYFGSSYSGGLAHADHGRPAGHGVGVGEGMLDLKQGELRQSDRGLDLAVDGTGFLVLLDGDKTVFARTGSFEVAQDGHIVLAGTTLRLATLDAAGRPVALSIDAARTSAPKPTTSVIFADNLSTTATKPVSVADIGVYDVSGMRHVWTATFEKDGTNAWKVTVGDDKGRTIGTGALKFTAGGTVDPTTTKLEFTDNGATVAFDFSKGVTAFSSGDVSTLRAASVDGQGAGTLTTVAVNADGKVELAYSNEQKTVLGAVALGDVRDPQSLVQRSGGLFDHAGGQGVAFSDSADPRVGKVVAQRLEASNVDLSREFGDLILIQRGFQASSQIVSVSNDMIQQLFGMRGQG
ncbi:flagellar hook-basal body complex protein [Sphingomonas hankookensis]|uniref:flagellar hook-basal body complex protein n=1 Tax=Sphingomonas hankookensis TaxID=563996 RepID=UPI001F595381|nr:flagellar hook-basal body complex protein [Sphingomonas hankookensis]